MAQTVMKILAQPYQTARRQRCPLHLMYFTTLMKMLGLGVHQKVEVAMATEFEQHCIRHAQVMLSCHLPEINVLLSKTSYHRIQQIMNDFFLWQAHQACDTAEPFGKEMESAGSPLLTAVLVDITQILVTISHDSNPSPGSDAPDICANEHIFSFNESRIFITNAGTSKGRTYFSFEAEKAQLQHPAADGHDIETVFSSTLALDHIVSPPSHTASLSLPFTFYLRLLCQEMSDMAIQLSWTTFTLGFACMQASMT